jgi:hypothetical protein
MGKLLLQSLNKMRKKAAIEMSFGWLFAIIAGVVIIFAAIYLSSKFIKVGQESVSAKTGKEIGILLDPLETSFESAQTTSITIPSETRINNQCEETGTFGRQIIQLDQKSFNNWIKTDVKVGFNNKYLFSKEGVEGKTFYIFSKPFNFPFKIADLFYITSADDSYCFIDAPEEISKELSKLNQSNLFIANCPKSSATVCFGNDNCDIKVDYSGGFVEKDGERMYFVGVGDDSTSLMYAAIFSDKNVYECQVNRLIMRLREISNLYIIKEGIIEKKGCESNLKGDLSLLSGAETDGSGGLGNLKGIVDEIDEKNNLEVCVLW